MKSKVNSRTARSRRSLHEVLAAFVEELESTADGNTRYAAERRKNREYASAQNALGTVKAFRWCAKRLREIAANNDYATPVAYPNPRERPD